MAIIEANIAQQLENVCAMQGRSELPTLEKINAEVAAEQEGLVSGCSWPYWAPSLELSRPAASPHLAASRAVYGNMTAGEP